MSIFASLLLSIPFYYLWDYLAPIYIPQLPEVYEHIPFWHCVGLFALVLIIRGLVFPHSFWGEKGKK